MKHQHTLPSQLNTLRKIRKPTLPPSRTFTDRKKTANKKACRKGFRAA